MLLIHFDVSEKIGTMTGEKKDLTMRSIPTRSPIQVLTPPSLDLLRWSDENRYFPDGMVVNICASQEYASL